MKGQIEWSYLFKHWFATLLIAPFLSDLFFYLAPYNHEIDGFISVYPFVFVMSFIFSLPTYMIYSIVFYKLKKESADKIFSKRMLLAISVSGIFITFTLFFPKMYFPVTVAYALSSLFTGICFRITKKLTTENC